MIKIVGGKHRGRKLETPDGRSLRPLRARVRESLFNIIGPNVSGLRFLDLCAGTGAVGIEALSRGFDFVVMNEWDKTHLEIIIKNLRMVGEEHARVTHGDAAFFRSDEAPFDLIFLAPPYASEVYEPAMARIVSQNLLASEGRLIVEHEPQRELAPPPELKSGKTYKYGRTQLSVFTL